MTIDPSHKALLDALIFGVKLKTPLTFNGKAITVLNLRGIKGRDLRRIRNFDDCGDDLIALSARLPESLVSTICAEDKTLAIAAIQHVCGIHLEAIK